MLNYSLLALVAQNTLMLIDAGRDTKKDCCDGRT